MKRNHTEIGGSRAWVEHFRASLRRPDIVKATPPIDLSPAELADIGPSVQEFQLGESSEGRHLIGAALRYAHDSGDFDYVVALRLFIAEENRHAQELGRFLDRAGIARVTASWPDTVFRFLRRRAGLELSIVVLVTAEIIAKVYYAALRYATGSPVLEELCAQILCDERHHVIFQAQRLALLRADRSRASILVRVMLHRLLLAGTCLVVWQKHGRAIRAGGMGFARFWREAWREMRAAIVQMNPRSYPSLTQTFTPFPIHRQSAAARPVRSVGAPPHTGPARRDALQLTSEDVT